jgi:hypothetical protein
MFEPALGMRDTPKMTQILGDWVHFGKWMKGEWNPPETKEERLDYELIEHPEGLRRYIAVYQHGFARSVAVDTEKHGSKPWSLQFSIRPGTGRMIRAEGLVEECVLEQFDWWLKENDVEAILHNAPQDLDTLDAMGIHVGKFRDTMQEAYQTNSLPQGLKALAHHFFGVEMKGWEETVWPASVDALTKWIDAAIPVAAERLSDAAVKHLARGKCGVCDHQHATGRCKRCGCEATPDRRVFDVSTRKPGAVESILRHVLLHTRKTQDDDKPYHPWKALARMKEEGLRGKRAEEWEWESVNEAVGPPPLLGIGNCDEREALMYAVGDADYTGRVAEELEKVRRDDRWKVDEGDYDV